MVAVSYWWAIKIEDTLGVQEPEIGAVKPQFNLRFIIIASIGGVIVLFLIIGIIALCCLLKKK